MAREGKVIVKILKDICQELPFFGHSHQRSKVTIVKPCENNLKKLECNLTFQQNSITQDNRVNFVLNADGTKGVESGTPIKYIVKRFDDDVLAKEEVVLQDNFGWAFQEVLWGDKIPRGKRVKYVFRLEAGKEFCEKELEYNKPATAICGENSLTKEEETNDYIKFRYKTYVSNFEDNLVRHLYKSIDGVNWSECPFTEENVHIADGSHVELLYTVQKSSLQGETHFKASVDVMTKGQLELTCETGTIELNPSIPDIKCSLNVSASKQEQPSGVLYYVNVSHGQYDVFPAHSFKMYLETFVDGVSKGKELIYENQTTGELEDNIQKEVFIDGNNFKKVIFKVTIELTNGTICEHNQTVFNFYCGNTTFRKENGVLGTNLIATITSNLEEENPAKEYYLYGKNSNSNWENIPIQPTVNGNDLIFANVPEKDTYKLTINYIFITNDVGGTATETCSTDWENQKQPPVCNNISITQKAPQGAGSYKMDITANVTLNDYTENFKLKIFTRSKNSVDYTLKSELDKPIGTTITETDFYDSSLSYEGYYLKAELWNHDNTVNYCNTDEQLIPKDIADNINHSYNISWYGFNGNSYQADFLRSVTLRMNYSSSATPVKNGIPNISSIDIYDGDSILANVDNQQVNEISNSIKNSNDINISDMLLLERVKLRNITEVKTYNIKLRINYSDGSYKETNVLEKINLLDKDKPFINVDIDWQDYGITEESLKLNHSKQYVHRQVEEVEPVLFKIIVSNNSLINYGKFIIIPDWINTINEIDNLPQEMSFTIDSSVSKIERTTQIMRRSQYVYRDKNNSDELAGEYNIKARIFLYEERYKALENKACLRDNGCFGYTSPSNGLSYNEKPKVKNTVQNKLTTVYENLYVVDGGQQYKSYYNSGRKNELDFRFDFSNMISGADTDTIVMRDFKVIFGNSHSGDIQTINMKEWKNGKMTDAFDRVYEGHIDYTNQSTENLLSGIVYYIKLVGDFILNSDGETQSLNHIVSTAYVQNEKNLLIWDKRYNEGIREQGDIIVALSEVGLSGQMKYRGELTFYQNMKNFLEANLKTLVNNNISIPNMTGDENLNKVLHVNTNTYRGDTNRSWYYSQSVLGENIMRGTISFDNQQNVEALNRLKLYVLQQELEFPEVRFNGTESELQVYCATGIDETTKKINCTLPDKINISKFNTNSPGSTIKLYLNNNISDTDRCYRINDLPYIEVSGTTTEISINDLQIDCRYFVPEATGTRAKSTDYFRVSYYNTLYNRVLSSENFNITIYKDKQ